jgi:hypothetical protein
MGAVWEAQHPGSGRRFALKMLRPAAAAHEPTRKRFLREARTAASVKHDNIVEITDVGTTEAGVPFIVMELLGGKTLEHVLRDGGALPWSRAYKILLQVADALEFAHEKGVVHRDLKPANVMMVGEGEDERYKLIDFGLARRQIISSTSEVVSHTGEVFGSPPYMSPEQFRGEPADPRTDVYGFGCLMFHVLTGQRPFPGQGIGELMYQHLFEPAPPPTGIDCPKRIARALETIVLRAMRKAPENRFADMGELAGVLRRLDHDPRPVDVPEDEGLPSRARSTLGGRGAWLLALGAVVLALGASLVIGWLQADNGAVEPGGATAPPATIEKAEPSAPVSLPAAEVTPEVPASAAGAGDEAGTGTAGDAQKDPSPEPEGSAGRKRKRRSEPQRKQPPAPEKEEPRTRELPPNPFRSGSRTPGENKP